VKKTQNEGYYEVQGRSR